MSLYLGNTKIPEVKAVKEIIGGMELPELDNPASNANVIQGYEYIDEDGNKKTGSFTMEPEITEQDTLLAELQTVLSGKTSGGAAEPVLQSKLVNPSTFKQIIIPDEGYDGLSQVDVNAMPTATQATPSISVNSSGLITASAIQSAGYVSSGTKSATKQLTTQAAKTVTPSENAQTVVNSGVYTTGAIEVEAIPDQYLAEAEVTAQDTLIANILTALEGKAAGGGGTSVDTCTVELSTDYGVFTNIGYSCVENGAILAKYQDSTASNKTQVVLENVLCGSYLHVSTSGTVGIENSYGVSLVANSNPFHWQITAKNGETAYINFFNPL